MADLDFFRQMSAKYSLPLQFIMKDHHLMDLLAQMLPFQDMGLVLKGGTAINKAYLGSLARFSEDLDFDFIRQGERKEKIAEIGKIKEGIRNYDAGRIRLFRDVARIDCFFVNEGGQRDNIRIEFNLSFSEQCSSLPVKAEVLRSAFTSSVVGGIRVYALEDLLARKISALHDRMEGKDMYDINTCFSMQKNNATVLGSLRLLMEAGGTAGTPQGFLEETVRRLSGVSAMAMKRMTNNHIPSDLRPLDWEEFIDRLKNNLESLLKPS